MGSLLGWYLTVRQGLGERAGGGGRSMGVRAEAQLENLSQAHILLGCPVGGGGMGRKEVNRVQPGTQLGVTPFNTRAVTPFNTRSRAGVGSSAAYCGRRQMGVGRGEEGEPEKGRRNSLKTLLDLYFLKLF